MTKDCGNTEMSIRGSKQETVQRVGNYGNEVYDGKIHVDCPIISCNCVTPGIALLDIPPF